MKKLGILFLIFAAGLLVYIVPSFRAAVVKSLSYSPCDTPITYTIGTIDPKFGLSKDAVVKDVETATNLWNSTEGKNLFVYSAKSGLMVNFVYDQRAALNSQINSLQSQLSQSNTTLSQQINAYNTQLADFQQKLAAFNATVQQYNSQGGAPQNVYNDLKKQQQELQQEGDYLNQVAQKLNLSTHSYNANVSILNGDITQFQNEIAQKPEEGLYNGSANTITVYFVNSYDELIHTLAHEFGHALGMQHESDPKAIMYAYASSSIAVSPSDTTQLQFICREQFFLIPLVQGIMSRFAVTK